MKEVEKIKMLHYLTPLLAEWLVQAYTEHGAQGHCLSAALCWCCCANMRPSPTFSATGSHEGKGNRDKLDRRKAACMLIWLFMTLLHCYQHWFDSPFTLCLACGVQGLAVETQICEMQQPQLTPLSLNYTPSLSETKACFTTEPVCLAFYHWQDTLFYLSLWGQASSITVFLKFSAH